MFRPEEWLKRNPPPRLFALSLLLCIAGGCAETIILKRAPTEYDAVVVGAGMGGLSAATHLAKGGMRVLLLEQHYKVGGCTTSFERGEFRFDAALHEMSMGGGDGGGLVPKILAKVDMTDRVEMIRVKEMGRFIFPGFEFVQPDGEPAMIAALKAKWPEESENVDEFFGMMRRMSGEVAELRDLYMANPVKALLTQLALPLRQRTLFKYHNETLEDVLDDFFDGDEIKATIAQFWLYHGPPPSRQWSIIYIIAQYSYILNGGWQIKGSSQALADAYRLRFEELGGEVMTDTRVTAINVERNRVMGVTIEGGRTFTSRFVVSNADPYQTFLGLIDEEDVPPATLKKVRAMEPSNSFAGVYLGLDVTPAHWGNTDYEIFLNRTMDFDLAYDNAMAGRWDDGFLSITLYGNLGDPYYAPAGKSVVSLHTYSDLSYWPEPGEEYDRKKAEMMEALITMAEEVLPGLRDHIVVKEGMTPRTIKSFTLNQWGVPYGFDFTVEQQNRIEIPSAIDGLYLAGAWTWPAHSVGMAQVSGFLAARMILKEDGLLP